MRVTRLEAFLVRVPLRRPVKHASYSRTESINLLVKCTLSDRTIGWGEGVPREYVTGETAETALQLLQEIAWKSLLAPCRSFAESVQFVEQFRWPEVPGDTRNCRGNAARCAVELALLDAFGRSFGEPLMNVTKQVAPELYLPQESVQYSGIVLTSSTVKARLFALGQRLYGLKQLKIKVGVAGANDVQRLQVIRQWAGSAMNLRVDANEAWPADVASNRIRELEPFNISSVEQPVPHEQVEQLARIRTQIQTPVQLDESLCSLSDAERAIQGHWCDGFNLRLSKCGGFIPTLKLAQLAAKHNHFCQLGCQVGETGVLSAAGRHLATSVKDLRFLEGSYDRRLVRTRLTEEDLTFGYAGRAPMLVGSGLGVRVDPLQVQLATIRQELLFDD